LINKTKIYGNLIGLGFFWAIATNGVAASVLGQQNPELKTSAIAPAYTIKTNQFPKLEQPIGLKLAVITVGLGLISAELWWFMFSKAK
jgi:plastocyanin domain-containing protein